MRVKKTHRKVFNSFFRAHFALSSNLDISISTRLTLYNDVVLNLFAGEGRKREERSDFRDHGMKIIFSVGFVLTSSLLRLQYYIFIYLFLHFFFFFLKQPTKNSSTHWTKKLRREEKKLAS